MSRQQATGQCPNLNFFGYSIPVNRWRMQTRWQTLAVLCVVVLAVFTVIVWRAQKSGGACRGSESYFCNLISPTNLPTDYLVLTGIGGIFVAIFTLRSIHHQAVQVRRQTKILKESADAAKGAADAAKRNIELLIGKERARVRVDSVNIRLVDSGVRRKGPPREADRIEFKVFCVGATDAFILEAGTCAFLSDSAEVKEEVTYVGLDLSKVLSPGKQAIERIEPIDPWTDALVERSRTVPNAKVISFLHFAVFVRYRDVFQTSSLWRMESRYVWRISHWSGEDGDNFAWSEYGCKDIEEESEGPN